ncbi:MAG: hypothetical protein ACE5J2_01780 [Nitrososphaerales archaeon]
MVDALTSLIVIGVMGYIGADLLLSYLSLNKYRDRDWSKVKIIGPLTYYTKLTLRRNSEISKA